MHPDLEILLKLQEKDKAVMEAREAKEALEPERRELDQALEQAQAAVESAKQRVEEADSRRAELEGKIEGYRVMQDRRRQRLEWVRGAKEASALMAELDLARSVLAREEAEWIRSADKVSEAQQDAQEAGELVETLKVEQAPKREELAAKEAECDDRLAAAQKAREEVAADVRPDLLERYGRVLQGRARLALYPLRNGACGHCFTAIPLHRRQKLQTGEELVSCEACGVMVFEPETRDDDAE